MFLLKFTPRVPFTPVPSALVFVVCMLRMRHKGTRGSRAKRSEGERKKRASRWDYVFMSVPRPISEMGAVPGIFSRPLSMACPRLVKSGSYWMDKLAHCTHTHTHREGEFPGSAEGLNSKAAGLQWSCDTIAQLSLASEGVAAYERLCDMHLTGCASLQNLFVYLSQWHRVWCVWSCWYWVCTC